MTETELDRRQFLRTALLGCASFAASGAAFRPVRRQPETLRIGFVPGADAGWTAARGVTLGGEEAARTGELVGRGIELVTVDSAALARSEGVAAIVGGADEDACRELGAAAESAGILFVNLGCRSDALRGEACGRGVFHVEASARMYADARAAGAEGAAEAVLWHPALERFGAAQLNDRHRARFGDGMDGPAWAGWMAVKLLWEASLRARTTEAAGIRAYLERAGTQFDGHKGWPLSFRPWDHQLRQPLYLVAPAAAGTRVVGEVPARPAEGGASFADLLDRLGADASASTCNRMRTGGTP
ncbi:MAG TPA: ABC transporter substrate-binding protein [Longimicrobium sp.]|nr:ABC transporter substrate-binding protein [Longimicrobium sp.]